MSTVSIWSDGACTGNPGIGGYAAIVKFKGKSIAVYGSAEYTTNNRMELLGFIAGIKTAMARASAKDIIIYTDSMYISNSINLGWLNRWHSTGYKDIKNVDLWQTVYKLLNRVEVQVKWVKGHSTNKLNAQVDEIAVAAKELQLPNEVIVEI